MPGGSVGNADGMGSVRKEELQLASVVLKVCILTFGLLSICISLQGYSPNFIVNAFYMVPDYFFFQKSLQLHYM